MLANICVSHRHVRKDGRYVSTSSYYPETIGEHQSGDFLSDLQNSLVAGKLYRMISAQENSILMCHFTESSVLVQLYYYVLVLGIK